MNFQVLKESEEGLGDSSKIINFLLLFVALFAISFTPIFVKISTNEIGVNATLFNRLWIVTIIFSCWSNIIWLNSKESETASLESPKLFSKIEDFIKQGGLWIAIVSIIHLSQRFTWTWALTETSTANATVLANVTPIFTTLGSWLFLGYQFDRRFLTGLLLSILGAIALVASHVSFSSQGLIGDCAALSAGVLNSIGSVISQKIRERLDASTYLLCRSAFSTVFIIPVLLLFEETIFPVSPLGWFSVIALALVSEAIAHGLVIYSMKHFTASFLSIFFLSQAVIATLLAWIFLHEKIGVINSIALAIIVLGIYLAKTGKGSEAKPKTE
ncbi:MAG: DMT family transporter [Nodosilinea sp. LVE1205-7]|jgi:drug/metabolite transporter (DMT)-like permease